MVFLCAGTAAGRIVLDAPGHVAVEGNATVARGGEPGAAFGIVDWRGCETGVCGVFDDEGVAAIPPLPAGYYRMAPNTTGEGGEAFATLAIVPPPESRVRDPASFYASDYGPIYTLWKGEKGWLCPWNGADRYRTLADLAWLAGVPHVRNRIEWSGIEPKPGNFNPEASVHWREGELLRERGVAVCGVFAGAPYWAKPRDKMPTDLGVVWSFCANVAKAFGDRMDAWEFWNEPDIGFAPGPVWDYAAAMKAAYLGFKAGRPEAVALPASHCRGPGNFYMRALYANDAAKFADAFNYHLGQPVSAMSSYLGALRRFLDAHGMEGRAIWITENECEMEGHATGKGVMEGHKAHSPEQELIVAEFYPKSMIAQQMAGVSRCYFFILGAYDERGGEKDWGMMRRDGTVKPVYAAMSTMTRELVSARLVGELDVGAGAKAFVFDQSDGSQTIAFWAVSPIDTANGDKPVDGEIPNFSREVVLHTDTTLASSFRLSDLCGSISRVSATNGVLALRATRFPAYVSGLSGLVAAKPAAQMGRIAPYVPASDEDLSVIVRAELDKGDFNITRNKTRAVLKKDKGRVRVFVWNLGDSAKTGILEVSGGILEGLPDAPFALGPRGSPPAVFDCLFAPADGAFDCDLVLRGLFGGKRGSRTVIPVWDEKRFFAGCKERPLASWRNPKAWTRNDSAQRWKCAWDESEQAMRFEFEWTESVGRWAYPYLHLAADDTLAGAKMLAFEVKTAQDKLENDHNYATVYTSRAALAYEHPNGNWERRYVELPGEGLDLERSVRIGVNPRGRKLTLWIRNVAVLK